VPERESNRSVKDTKSVAPSDLALAKEFARRLAEHYDPTLFQVTLFGSRARGDMDEEAALDLFNQSDPRPRGLRLLPVRADYQKGVLMVPR
jgi:predicted nucleotidyltransferase